MTDRESILEFVKRARESAKDGWASPVLTQTIADVFIGILEVPEGWRIDKIEGGLEVYFPFQSCPTAIQLAACLVRTQEVLIWAREAVGLAPASLICDLTKVEQRSDDGTFDLFFQLNLVSAKVEDA